MLPTIIRGLANAGQIPAGCVLTMGNFDGVHVGHQALLKQLVAKARELNKPSVVMIFEPQPFEFFLKGKCAARLTRLREKLYWLSQYDVDYVLVVKFNAAFAALPAQEFIEKVLIKLLRVGAVLVGDDFHFGYKREGNFELLRAESVKFHFHLHAMDTFMLDGVRVSSTLVRKALENADHDLVRKLLGHPYYMMGRVVHGDKRGRKLGFPTANIYLHRTVTPVHGIYAVKMLGVESEPLVGVANVGTRPTVGGTKSLLEVHLFDYDDDLYGKHVGVEFCKKFRDEEHYQTLEELQLAIAKDVEQGQEYFKKLNE